MQLSEHYSSREIISVLGNLGFTFTSQKGSHAKYKDSKGNIVIIPMSRKEIPEGTFKSILKQADITVAEFKDNL